MGAADIENKYFYEYFVVMFYVLFILSYIFCPRYFVMSCAFCITSYVFCLMSYVLGITCKSYSLGPKDRFVFCQDKLKTEYISQIT